MLLLMRAICHDEVHEWTLTEEVVAVVGVEVTGHLGNMRCMLRGALLLPLHHQSTCQ